jgi:hypothetical protein
MIPGGDALNKAQGTRGAFAHALLNGLGAPANEANVRAMLAWMTGENTRAANNPLATTREGFSGATDFNSARVKNFQTFAQGVAATLETLNLSYYTDVVAALRRGTNPQELHGLVAASPWGTKHFGSGDLSLQTTPLGNPATARIAYQSDDMITASDYEDAWVLLKDQLTEYGLEDLYDFAYEMTMTGASESSVMIQLRDQPAYKERFLGMERRKAAGYRPISPYDYLELEKGYRRAMTEAGLPETLFDSKEDFAEFIGNDISVNELEERVDLAAAALNAADPEIRNQLEELYGVGGEGDGELIAYYLDPERTVNYLELKQQQEAASLSAAAVGALGEGGGLSRAQAERLAEQNIQAREITARLGGRGSLTQSLLGSEGMSSSEFAAAEFGLDSESVAQLRRTQQIRQGMGKRRSGSMATQQGVTGLGSANS